MEQSMNEAKEDLDPKNIKEKKKVCKQRKELYSPVVKVCL